MDLTDKHYYSIDRKQLALDLDEAHSLIGAPDENDFKHLIKIKLWGQFFTVLGYATAWMIPFNPFSFILIGIGNFSCWANVTHPILHKGYDRIENIPKKYTSKVYAHGWRRFIDWLDWIRPIGWNAEHNELHHYNLGEKIDPGHIENNMAWLRHGSMPMSIRYLIVILFSFVWKITYFAPSAETVLAEQKRLNNGGDPNTPLQHITIANPFRESGVNLWLRGFLPYLIYRFIILPSLFLPLGIEAARNVLYASFFAEIIANMQSFLMIVPNHAGEDLYLFNKPAKGKGEFYLRQILGSANFNTGSNINDFFHGWLNYQIEHHIFPDLPLSKYQKIQPHVKRICKQHGLPYHQGNVFKRLLMCFKEMVGRSNMIRIEK